MRVEANARLGFSIVTVDASGLVQSAWRIAGEGRE